MKASAELEVYLSCVPACESNASACCVLCLQVRRRWKPYREYVVLSLSEDGGDVHQPRNNLPPSEPPHHHHTNNNNNNAVRLMSTSDVDCLSALHAAFHELQLVRSQRRPHSPRPPPAASAAPKAPRSRHELLLGDVHSRPDQRGSYRPTAFQVPLLRADQVSLQPPHSNCAATKTQDPERGN